MTTLKAQGLSKSFRSRKVVDDLNLEISGGEVVGLLGPNGAGKTTAFYMIVGLIPSDSGHIYLGDRDITGLSMHRRAKLGLGYLPQEASVFRQLSVEDNIALPEWIAGSSMESIRGRLAELLERVGLAERRRDAVQKLSGGEMQRVAICRALLRRPRLLLADEPTGNLDDDSARRVMDLLLQLASEEGSALVYVTHDPDLAALGDETWRLHSGLLETG